MKKLKSVFYRFINNPFVLLALSLPCPVIALNIKMTTIFFILFLIYCFVIIAIASKSNSIYWDNIIDTIIKREGNKAIKEHEEFIQKINNVLDKDNVRNHSARFEITMLMMEAIRRERFDDKNKQRIIEIYKEQGLSYYH
jgi:hypothetical protein